MTTKRYTLANSDGWTQFADGSAIVVIQVLTGNVYMALEDAAPDLDTLDHHALPEWTTLSAASGSAYLRSQTEESTIVVSTIATE